MDPKYFRIRRWLVTFTVLLFTLGLSTATFAQLPQEQREAPPMEQPPQEQMQREVLYEDEIKEKELPAAISTSIKETYPDYKISESYRGSDGSFKIKLDKGTEKASVYYNPEGEFLRIEEDNDDDTINDDWR